MFLRPQERVGTGTGALLRQQEPCRVTSEEEPRRFLLSQERGWR